MADVDAAGHGSVNETMTIERTLAQHIHAFSNMISGHFFRRTEQPFGVGLPEWRVLRSVLLSPGCSQGEIAISEGLNVMNVSRAVAGLRRKGLIEVEADPEDRRRTMLSATDIGEELGSDMADRERLVYEHVFSVLRRDEIEQLDELLDRVNTSLRVTELPDPPPASRDWAAVISAHVDSD